MRVLYLTNNAGRASTTVATRGWIEHLTPRGLEPVVASPVLGEFSDRLASRGQAAYQVPLPLPSKIGFPRFAAALWKLRRIVKRHDVQLIHCNEQDIYPIGQYLARLCRVPVVVTVHFTLERGFCQWTLSGKKIPDRIFFISRGNLDACRPGVSGIIPEDRWRLLYNGLDLEAYVPDATRRERFRKEHHLNGHIAVGVGCAIRPRKQLEHLFSVVEASRDDRIRVVLAGGPVPGDEEYSDALIEDAKRRFGERFVFLGYLNELRNLYNGLDIFVNTSREEACSISVMESLACGCPVLGYASKSVDDQILPNGGQIVTQDNTEELQAALTDWVKDDQGLTGRRVGARACAEEKFDAAKLSQQLWDEYQQLV